MASSNKIENLTPASGTTKNGNFLFDSLAPLWKITYYTNILPDWCYPIGRNNSGIFYSFLRFTMISLTIITILVMTTFESYQMAVVIPGKTWITNDDIVMNFVWFMPLPQTCWNMYFFLSCRFKMLPFFEKILPT